MPLGPRPLADRVAGLVVGLGGELAVVDVDDLGPAAAAVEAERRALGPLAERVLELVPVAPALDRRLDRLELEALEPPEPAQRLVDLLRLVSELALVGQPLPGGARGRARPRAGRCRRSCRGRARAARPRSPRRSRASPSSAGRGPGRRAARPRRRRRSRRRARPRARPGRASRSRARARSPARCLMPDGLHAPYRCSVATALDLDDYRNSAESFLEEIEREYYLHLAGHKPELELEPIYERHAGLFSAERIAELRELAEAASGEHARGLRYLLAVRARRPARRARPGPRPRRSRGWRRRSRSRSAASPCPSARW